MSDRGGLIGEILEEGGSIVKQTAKTVVKTPVHIISTAGSQISGTAGITNQPTSEDLSVVNQPQQKTKQFSKPQTLAQSIIGTGQEKTSEEQQEIEKLRRELHSQYYQTLTQPKKQDERPVEKLEREEGEKMQELQIKQKEEQKKEPISVTRAKGKAEKFRGVSG